MGEVVSDPVHLTGGVVLRRTPKWLKERELDFLSGLSREKIRGSSLSLSIDYEGEGLGEHQKRAEQTILLANLALWLAKPAPTGIEARLHFELPTNSGSTPLSATWGSKLVHHDQDKAGQLTAADLELAADLQRAVAQLPRDSLLWTATRVLWRALCDDWWQSRYLFLWIAMEALFGPKNGKMISRKLSKRSSSFLCADSARAEKLRETVRTGYMWRSRTVHGHDLDGLDPEESGRISHEVEGFLRESMVKILTEVGLTGVFNGDGRDDHLDSLAHQRFGTS